MTTSVTIKHESLPWVDFASSFCLFIATAHFLSLSQNLLQVVSTLPTNSKSSPQRACMEIWRGTPHKLTPTDTAR